MTSARIPQPLTLLLFSVTMLVSAAAMFMLQPMVGKMLLPLVGGTPAGWVIAMAFFQVMLLVGYGLAYLLAKRSPLFHGIAYVIALLIGLAFLPVTLPAQYTGGIGPFDVFRLLLAATALPFIAISATSSTVQRIFSTTGHASAADPYFLYAASNLGSFAGLLLYPLLAEVNFTLEEQTALWKNAYTALAVLACFCVLAAGKTEARAPASSSAAGTAINARQKFTWAALAFIPSSLLLGVTTHITTDIIAAPLLWIIPLGLYLLTYVVAFAQKQVISYDAVLKLQPPAVALTLTVMILLASLIKMSWYAMGWHLVTFVLVALMCHMRLAALRPAAASRLTEYYLIIATGGALGGVFNAFVAPFIFDRLLEYPFVLALSLLLHPGFRPLFKWQQLAAYSAACLLAVPLTGAPIMTAFVMITFGIVALYPKPAVIGSILALLFEHHLLANQKTLLMERNFYGVLKLQEMVEKKDDKEYKGLIMFHGTTNHGYQLVSPPGLDATPTSYFAKQGPFGEAFATVQPKNTLVIGLGAGTLACYSTPATHMTFIELDPAVVKMARENFTYLEKCKGAKPHRVITGDGRIELSKLEGEKFDLIVMDAFSSDMVPVHLITLDALALYQQHLNPGGAILLNISNRYIKLAPVLAASAKERGLTGMHRLNLKSDTPISVPSQWFIMTANGKMTERLKKKGWEEVPEARHVRPWTDSYSSILNLIRI